MWFSSKIRPDCKEAAAGLLASYQVATSQPISDDVKYFLASFLETCFSQLSLRVISPRIDERLIDVIDRDFSCGEKSVFLDVFFDLVGYSHVDISEKSFIDLISLLLEIYSIHHEKCLYMLEEAVSC